MGPEAPSRPRKGVKRPTSWVADEAAASGVGPEAPSRPRQGVKRPTSRVADEAAASEVGPEAPSRPRKGVKRPTSWVADEAAASKLAPAGPGALSELDQGRGFALLAANPDIPKSDFVASLINSNADLDEARVQHFFYNCHKRTRFPAFVRDFLETHPEYLMKREGVISSLKASLLPLFQERGFHTAHNMHGKAIPMWGNLVLGRPRSSYSTETTRGLEFIRLSRSAQVELFTQLWREYGSPPISLVVAANEPSSRSGRVLTDADRVAALELLERNPLLGASELVEAFMSSNPRCSLKAVKTMFKRYRGWTTIPLWMHETLRLNAHLAEKEMPTLIQLVLEEGDKAGRKCPYSTEEFVRGWIKFCVVDLRPVVGSPEPCVRETTRGGVFVRMTGDVQKAFFASRRAMATGKIIESSRKGKSRI